MVGIARPRAEPLGRSVNKIGSTRYKRTWGSPGRRNLGRWDSERTRVTLQCHNSSCHSWERLDPSSASDDSGKIPAQRRGRRRSLCLGRLAEPGGHELPGRRITRQWPRSRMVGRDRTGGDQGHSPVGALSRRSPPPNPPLQGQGGEFSGSTQAMSSDLNPSGQIQGCLLWPSLDNWNRSPIHCLNCGSLAKLRAFFRSDVA
jgi:hypothetical protein